MSDPLSVAIEGELLEVVVEEERIVLELWAGFGNGDAISLQGRPVVATAPTLGQALAWDGAGWAPASLGSQAQIDQIEDDLAAHIANVSNPHTTTAAQVGAYTTAQVDTALAGKSDVGHTHTFASLTSKPTTLAGYGITDGALDADLDALALDFATHEARTDNPHAVTKAQVGLGNVENTALSTWAGSDQITTLGTIATGTWNATAIAWTKVSKTGSSLADLTTRSASDLSSGNLAYAQMPTGSGSWDVGSGNTLTMTRSLTVSGTLTVAGNIVGSVIRQSTADASDNATLILTGGGGSGAARGAFITLHGNEHANLGLVSFSAGNAATDIAYEWTTGNLNVQMRMNVGGVLFLADSANANMTRGITINQAVNDDEILAFKSSDIAHGVTAVCETDTYGFFKKASGANGILQITGFSESTSVPGMILQGYSATETTTATTTAQAHTLVDGYLYSGTDVTNAGAGALIFGVRTRLSAATRSLFFVDAEGDLFVDGSTSLTAFDERDGQALDDLALVRAIDLAHGRNVVRSRWDEFVGYNEEDLVRLGILAAPRAHGGMVCVTQLQRLHNGALWQLNTRQMEQEERGERLRASLLALLTMNPGLGGAERVLALLEDPWLKN